MSVTYYKNKGGLMNRLTQILIVLIVALGFSYFTISSSAYQTEGDEAGKYVKWSYDKKTHTLTFIGKGKMFDASWYDTDDNLVMEWDHWRDKVKKVVFSEGITYVGFSCCHDMCYLTKVEFPSTLKTIGASAFKNCESLRKIRFPNKLKKIGEYTFENCSIKTIHLPNSIKKIGEGAFMGCKVRKMNYPKSIKEIPAGTYFKSDIKEFTVPKHIEKISDAAFENCKKLKKITFSSKTNYIGTSAFSGCKSLKKVKFPKKMKVIDDRAFRFCTSIKQVVVPENVEVLGYRSFAGCDNLKNFIVKSKKIKKYEYVQSGKCTESMLEITIPEGTEEIADYALERETLKKVTIESSVKKIGRDIFGSHNTVECITFLGTELKLLEFNSLQSVNEDCTIYVPNSCLENYKELFYKARLNKEVQVVGY